MLARERPNREPLTKARGLGWGNRWQICQKQACFRQKSTVGQAKLLQNNAMDFLSGWVAPWFVSSRTLLAAPL